MVSNDFIISALNITNDDIEDIDIINDNVNVIFTKTDRLNFTNLGRVILTNFGEFQSAGIGYLYCTIITSLDYIKNKYALIQTGVL